MKWEQASFIWCVMHDGAMSHRVFTLNVIRHMEIMFNKQMVNTNHWVKGHLKIKVGRGRLILSISEDVDYRAAADMEIGTHFTRTHV